MINRFFNEKVKNQALMNNFNKNNGVVRCDICSIQLNSTNNRPEYDHIIPFVKGGKSILSNCQILCSKCNREKNAKDNELFLLQKVNNNGSCNNTDDNSFTNVSREEFDTIVSRIIDENGNITSKDFNKSTNALTSHYLKKYYGTLTNLRNHFGLPQLNKWDRDKILIALSNWIKKHNNIIQSELSSKNGLPTMPCILHYYPEYNTFSDIKTKLLNLEKTRKSWNRGAAIQTGIDFISKHGSIHQSDFKAINNLPTYKYVVNEFGSLQNYQKIIGSPISYKNQKITCNQIEQKIRNYFGKNERTCNSINDLCNELQISKSLLYKEYGSIENFINKNNITIKNTRKTTWSKEEIDRAIYQYIKIHNNIPLTKNFTLYGLPCIESIQKFYDNWREPFHTALYINELANTKNLVNKTEV